MTGKFSRQNLPPKLKVVSGVRELPIVFIDDVYTGNAATVFQLDTSGQLDKILKVCGLVVDVVVDG